MLNTTVISATFEMKIKITCELLKVTHYFINKAYATRQYTRESMDVLNI